MCAAIEASSRGEANNAYKLITSNEISPARFKVSRATRRSNRRGNFYFDEYARQSRQLADPYYIYTVCAGLYIFRPLVFFTSARFDSIHLVLLQFYIQLT